MNDHIDQSDRRLRALHRATGYQLDAVLDLDSGLREILIAVQYREVGSTLDGVLDVDAGLQAIVPAAKQRTAIPAAYTPTCKSTKVNGAVATLLMSLDTQTRLAIRNHPALDALAIVFILTQAHLTGPRYRRGLTVNLHLNRARNLALGLAHDLTLGIAHDLTLNLGLALGLAHDLTLDLTRTRGLTLDLALARALARALALARTLTLTLARTLDLALTHALTHDLTRNLDLTRNIGRDHALTHDRDHDDDHALNLNTALVRDLNHARHDFTTADLRGANLTEVQLDRLRWSTITLWPSETWRDQALRDSTEVEPGIFEIRGGTTKVPTHIR
jgi:hypothetical protein